MCYRPHGSDFILLNSENVSTPGCRITLSLRVNQLVISSVRASVSLPLPYLLRGAGFVYARHTRATPSMTICSELRAGISRLSIAAHPNRTRVERIRVEWRASVQGAGCMNRFGGDQSKVI